MRDVVIDEVLVGDDGKTRRTRFASALGGAAAVLAVGLVLASCSGSSTAKSVTPATKPAAVTKPGTTTTLPLVRTPTDAAEQLYFAWQRADKSGAARIASDGAVSSLFAIKSTKAAGLAFVGCTKTTKGASTCTWSRHDAKLTMHVNAPGHGMPQVQTVALS